MAGLRRSRARLFRRGIDRGVDGLRQLARGAGEPFHEQADRLSRSAAQDGDPAAGESPKGRMRAILYPHYETPAEFVARMRTSQKTFSRKMSDERCPQNSEIDYGPSGRVLRLRASRELEEFMRDRRKTR